MAVGGCSRAPACKKMSAPRKLRSAIASGSGIVTSWSSLHTRASNEGSMTAIVQLRFFRCAFGLFSCLAFLLCFAASAAELDDGAAPSPAEALSLDWVLGEVARHNPALKAARANSDAALARVRQARDWDDPRVGVDFERSGTRQFSTYSAAEFMVGQTLPLSGKNRQRGRAAAAEAAAAAADARRRELDLLARAKIAYFRYANAWAQTELNRQNEQLLLELISTTRQKFAVGTRTQADVLSAHTDLARLLEVRADLERDISNEQTALNVLMNQPAYAELPPPVRLAFKPLVLSRFRPPPRPHAGDEEGEFVFDWRIFQQRMQSLALEHRPELGRAEENWKAARARLGLARRAWIPDPELRLEARQFRGGAKAVDEYDTGIFFSMPWVNRGKYRAAVDEGEKTVEAAEQELIALQAETVGLIRDQTRKIETAQIHYFFIRDRILPLARQTVEAMHSAYLADRVSFLEMLTAQRTLQDSESMLDQRLADYLSALAEMEALTGEDL
jgi:outer membrane protein TolC